jgi:hypothetical protein
MAGRAAHLAKAGHNERFSDRLAEMNAETERFEDWEVTSLFYAAVHLADAYLANLGGHPVSHVQPEAGKVPGRNQLVRRHIPLVWPHYRQLQNLSHVERYDAEARIPRAQVDRARSREYEAVKCLLRT